MYKQVVVQYIEISKKSFVFTILKRSNQSNHKYNDEDNHDNYKCKRKKCFENGSPTRKINEIERVTLQNDS